MTDMKTQLTKRVEWVMGHRIPDHSLDQHLHGHRFALEATIIGKVDLGDLKECLQVVIKPLDHAFVFWKQDKLMVDFFRHNPRLKHLSLAKPPLIENLIVWLARQLLQQPFLRQKARLISLTLWESPSAKTSLHLNSKNLIIK